MTETKKAMNIRETAAFLNVHEQTVRKLARAGKIPAFKVGRDWRFSGDALDSWAASQRFSPKGVCDALVIDDDELVRKHLRRLLSRLGCDPRSAENGMVALEMVARRAPDLILLDLVMPEMNGPQFLKRLRVDHPDLPVIVVTGYPDGELMQQAMAHGPISLLAKPVDHELMAKTVKTLVGSKLPQASGDNNG